MPSRYAERFEHLYVAAAEEQNGLPQLLLGLPRNQPAPPFAQVRPQLARPGWTAEWMQGFVRWYHQHTDLVELPLKGTVAERAALPPRFTLLGWWLVLGALLSLLPPFMRSLGVWFFTAAVYLLLVFTASHTNGRYFAPAYPVLIMLLPVVPDLILRAWRRRQA